MRYHYEHKKKPEPRKNADLSATTLTKMALFKTGAILGINQYGDYYDYGDFTIVLSTEFNGIRLNSYSESKSLARHFNHYSDISLAWVQFNIRTQEKFEKDLLELVKIINEHKEVIKEKIIQAKTLDIF